MHNNIDIPQVGTLVLVVAAGIAGYVYAVSTRGDAIQIGVQYRSARGDVISAWFNNADVQQFPANQHPPPAPQAPYPPNPPNAGGQPGQGYGQQHAAYPPPSQTRSAALPYPHATPTQPPPAQHGQPAYYTPPPPGHPRYTAQYGYYPPGYNGSNAGGNMGKGN